MVVAKGQRTEAAEEIEDLAAVLVDVEHALGALDLDLVEAEQLHEMQLTGIEVRLEQVGHASDIHRLGLLDTDQVGLGGGGRRQRRGAHHGARIRLFWLGHDGHFNLLSAPTTSVVRHKTVRRTHYSAGTCLVATA